MKDEKERMQEYLKDYTNAHGNLPKSKKTEKTIHSINISLSSLVIVFVIILIIMVLLICINIKMNFPVFFTMNKEQFIKEIENKYNQKVEIIEDNSTSKGNGIIAFKSKKEPNINFYASKHQDSYRLDYEEKAFLYYMENSNDRVFENITVEQELREVDNKYPDKKFLFCKIYLNINSYTDIESACKQRYELQKWMKQKIKTFDIEIHLKIGDRVSYLWSYEDLNILTYKEKYEYYWYLVDNKKDTSEIPKEDIENLNKPKKIEVLINGKRVIDKEETKINELKNSYNIKTEETAYLSAEYDMDTQTYQMPTERLLINCDKFEILTTNTNEAFKFKYKNKTYEVHYLDNKLHGNKLPSTSKLEYFEKAFDAKLEYDYDNKKVNIEL